MFFHLPSFFSPVIILFSNSFLFFSVVVESNVFQDTLSTIVTNSRSAEFQDLFARILASISDVSVGFPDAILQATDDLVSQHKPDFEAYFALANGIRRPNVCFFSIDIFFVFIRVICMLIRFFLLLLLLQLLLLLLLSLGEGWVQGFERKAIFLNMNEQISILGKTFDEKSSQRLIADQLTLDAHVSEFFIPKFKAFLITKQFLAVWGPLPVRVVQLLLFFFLVV
jgi:hypothetical protein